MHSTLTRRSLALMFLGVFLFTGCSFSQLKNWGLFEKNADKALQSQLAEGNLLFEKGDFEAAEKIFQDLRSAGNPLIKRQAIYGLACTHLMIAENRAEYIEAVYLLDQWRRISSDAFGPEDPRMFLSFFPEMIYQKSKKENKASENEKTMEEPFLFMKYDYEKEIEALQRRIRSMEKRLKIIDTQKAEMEEMEDELKKLKDQIETIETIDQEIQEKKQGLSSP